ncbi:MAG TPA: alpha/beta fold hydrolase [Candidatus Binataceae bacterium]|nr:alpha/beta fold hydrolase [Candidatus Binataceae bacterium]
MEIELGRFRAGYERPEPVKFAWPVLLLPDLFTTTRHLTILTGYLATIGWEVYVPDLRNPASGSIPAHGQLRFTDSVETLREAVDAIGRDTILLGHGAGGLAALAMSAHPRVRAAIAFAPLIPGQRTSLSGGIVNRFAAARGVPTKPPRGRTLGEFLGGADPFQHEAITRAMVPESAVLLADIAGGAIDFGPLETGAPRLIVAGESDRIAPIELVARFAESINAQLARLPGRGHWLVGGRALEAAIAKTQRFLVRALGQELLLLYTEEWKSDVERSD